MLCPHCSQPIQRASADEYPASTQRCPACGVATFIEGDGFTARPEGIGAGIARYTCSRCGHVREVTIPDNTE